MNGPDLPLETAETLRDELRSLETIVGSAPVFSVESAPENPRALFVEWLHYAIGQNTPEPHAATLSTMGQDGVPDARVLIIKGVTDDCGFRFATGDESAKGQQLLHNPACALTFYWTSLARSIRIRGIAQQASAEESAADFQARSKSARAIAAAGRQSSVMETLTMLPENTVDQSHDAPSSVWSVWTLQPAAIEFWQGARSRNHRRLRYLRNGDSWQRQQLWP